MAGIDLDMRAGWSGRTRLLPTPPIAEISALAQKAKAEGASLINLGQAILGMAPPRSAICAVERYLRDTEVHGYSPDPGLPEAREAIAGFLRRAKGLPATPASLMLTCGANQAFVNALLAITSPGDEVLLFAPYYFDHVFAISLAGCEAKPIPIDLALDAKGRLPREALLEALSPKTRAVVVISPANPAGVVFGCEEVAWLVDFCAQRGLWLISDETYDLLTYAPVKHCPPGAQRDYERIITLGSFSKTFGLAAWRLGYLQGSERLIEETLKVQDALVVCAPVPSQIAAVGALEDADAYLPAVIEALTARRRALLAGLAKIPWLDPLPPDGATFTMARLPEGIDSLSLAKRLVIELGLVSVPGIAFGEAGEGYLRLSFGNLPVDALHQATSRLASFAL